MQLQRCREYIRNKKKKLQNTFKSSTILLLVPSWSCQHYRHLWQNPWFKLMQKIICLSYLDQRHLKKMPSEPLKHSHACTFRAIELNCIPKLILFWNCMILSYRVGFWQNFPPISTPKSKLFWNSMIFSKGMGVGKWVDVAWGQS